MFVDHDMSMLSFMSCARGKTDTSTSEQEKGELFDDDNRHISTMPNPTDSQSHLDFPWATAAPQCHHIKLTDCKRACARRVQVSRDHKNVENGIFACMFLFVALV